MRKILLLALLVLSSVGAWAQGVTTAGINGQVMDSKGETLPGATVLATHTPSGTQYGATTDANGRYRIPNARVGGPYKVTISFVGYANFELSNVFLTLGQNSKIDGVLSESSTQLQEVTVKASALLDSDRTGQKTVIDQRAINSTPTVARALADFARSNPLANIQQNADGFSISLAGQNNRFNTVYVDGTVNNDVFGLANSGTNGGQTGVQPISLDAIEQFQVSVSPFDVRQSGFAGGSINAVTRSGTNDFEGSTYYLFRNQKLAGKTPVDDNTLTRKSLNDFSAKTFGVRLGGPLVKDKVFFFANAEFQRDETPQPFDFSTYQGRATRDTITALLNKLNGFNYNPGGFEENTLFLNSDKYLFKVDWNINKNHKLTVRHSYVKAENLEARRSTSTRLSFLEGSEYFVSKVNSSALEFKSVFGNKFSNKFVLGVNLANDDRDAYGSPFPTLNITDGTGLIQIGAEPFSAANLLEQRVITVTDDFEMYLGKHTITLGTHNEFYKMGNLFIRNNYGTYSYDSVAQFLYDINADTYERSFSLRDNVVGDDTDAIAAFSAFQLGLYAQDDFQVSNALKLTFGVRLDLPVFPDKPLSNSDFDTNAIPAIEAAGYDLRGARPGAFIDPQLLISPRIGVNYDVLGDRSLIIRGGTGIFTSRVPLVWPGGAYNNFGLNIGGVRITNSSVPFNPNVNAQFPTIDPSNPTPSGQIDLFASNFKLPQVFKANVAVDKTLPWGLLGTFEALFTKTINNTRYENLNLKPSTSALTGADNRPLFNNNDLIDPTYTGIYLASNTNKGYSYNIVAQLTKDFDAGFSGSAAYTYGDSYALNDNLSSQNNSQFATYKNVKGRNFETAEAQRSVHSLGHRVVLQASYRKEYLGFGASQISLFYNGQSGQPFTYVVGNETTSRQLVNDGGSNNSDPIYIPKNQTDIVLTNKTVGTVTYTAQQQWDLLNEFIENDPYLSKNRGQYAERNASRTPFESIIDFRFVQEFYLKMADGKRNTLQFTFDIFNFSNFLNKDWGRRYFVNFNDFQLLEFQRFTPTTTVPEYRVNTKILEGKDPWANDITDSGFRSSRWQMQIGLRYTFGG